LTAPYNMTVAEPNINDVFFAGMYKDVWKKLIPPGLTEAETEFIREIAGLSEGKKVLDLMCGNGRHTLLLGKKGLAVDAVDNQEDYISELTSAAEKDGLPIKAFLTGALDFSPADSYDAIICMGNSLAFFNREDTLTLLRRISGCLKEGGTLIINSWMIAEIAFKHFRERDWQQVGNYKYLLDYKYHINPSRIESEHTILREDGAVEVIRGVDYIFTLQELAEMFRVNGLRIRSLFSTPKKKKFTLGDNRIYIVVEKVQPAV
jgi:cyclopropane fatty-acyl-phospholipid synthase-like methyltransferase